MAVPRAQRLGSTWGVLAAPGLGVSTSTVVLVGVMAALSALAIALAGVRPNAFAPLSYDAYATTLHFERIAAGQHLEGNLGTTPKPLLTLAFGLGHALGGWTAVSVLSIVAWSLSTGVAVALATRLAGVVSGVAAAVLLIASPTLLLETAWGLGTVWAIGLWSAAALAAIARPPRWTLCGLLLGLAVLVRVETVLVVALGIVVVLALRVIRGATPGWRRPLAVAWAAWSLPVMLIHDSLLTGDPLYWTKVSAVYGQALAGIGALPSPSDAAALVVTALAAAPILVVLAAAGVILLVRARAWAVLVGLAALGPGVALALPLLAASGRLADARYLEPIRCALVLPAAVTIGYAIEAAFRLRRQPGPTRSLLRPRLWPAVVAGAVVALAASPVIAPLDAGTQATIARFRTLAQTAEIAEPQMRSRVAETPALAAWPGSSKVPGTSRQDLFAVPGNVRARLALDLGLPLTRLVATDATHMNVAGGSPPIGEIVVHSGGDVPAAAFAPFEASAPSTVGQVLVVPLLADPANVTWVVRLDMVGGGSNATPIAR